VLVALKDRRMRIEVGKGLGGTIIRPVLHSAGRRTSDPGALSGGHPAL